MKGARLLPFTPTLSDPEALRSTLLAERASIERLEAITRQGLTSETKSYPILLGPSGCGKTHVLAELARRIADGGPASPHLAWLHEEEWGVGSYLDLLQRLLEAARIATGRDDTTGLADRRERREDALERVAEEALVALTEKDSILWVIERIDTLLETVGDAGQRKLRALLQNHPRFVIVGSARHRPPAVSDRRAPFFGFFDILRLPPLTADESRELAQRVALLRPGRSSPNPFATAEGRVAIDAARRVGGGNPRFTIMFVQALEDTGPAAVEDALLRALDELTPLARARLRHLSPQQRRLVDAFVRLRRAIPVARLAKELRLTHQTTSGQLKKLRELGIVVAHPIGRESWYELADPSMRQALALKRVPDEQIRAWHAFLVAWLGAAGDGGSGTDANGRDLPRRARAVVRRTARPKDRDATPRSEAMLAHVVEPLEAAVRSLEAGDPRGPLGLPLEQRRLFFPDTDA